MLPYTYLKIIHFVAMLNDAGRRAENRAGLVGGNNNETIQSEESTRTAKGFELTFCKCEGRTNAEQRRMFYGGVIERG